MGAGPGGNKNAWTAPRAKAQLRAVLWPQGAPSYLFAGQKLGIHTLSTAKSVNSPVGALSLHDMGELRNVGKSDKQLLCVIILSCVHI